MRTSGILLPVTSLPSPYGIGCFSKEAYTFVDQLQRAGQKYWQILPLGPTGYGDSPYQSFSTFAGNPYLIDLVTLIEEGLLQKEECDRYDFGGDASKVDYEKQYLYREKLLRKAFSRSHVEEDPEFQKYCEKNAFWLRDYAMFTTIKKTFGGKGLGEWEDDIRMRRPGAMDAYQKEYAQEILFYEFVQYQFYKQWTRLKKYANEKGIEIIGDLPIYVAYDSADSWAHPELFWFDENNMPVQVAGCPPDGFSETGQLWGNPLYRWEYHKDTEYAWWISRIRHAGGLYDVVRIDHFRGFDEYYAIPYGEETAKNGSWKKGPGYDIFRVIKEKLGDVPIIAEDLGYLTDSVRELVQRTGYPGMKIIEFAFDSRESGDYFPYHYEKNSVVYTGTHDNNTICGWYQTLNPEDRELALRYLGREKLEEKEIPWAFIHLALSSVCDCCIIPMQDYLGLSEEARMNTPSTMGGNWRWRLLDGEVEEQLVDRIRKAVEVYGRLAQSNE